jgi:phage tail sheath protein FI
VVVASVRAGLVTLEGGIANGYVLDPRAPVTFVSNEFSLSVMGSALETFPGLSMDRRHPRFYGQFVQSSFVRVLPPSDPTTSVPADARPREVSAAPLHGGLDDDPRSLDPSHFDAAIEALDAIDGVNFIAIPDSQVAAVQQNLIDHCVTRGDRFAVLDAPFGRDLSDVLSHRDLVTSERGFAALYHPWVVVRDPQMRGQILSVPPSGCIAGIYARVDTQRGVHKAPANETVRGILTLERTVTERQQLVLNPAGVNVLRILPGGGQPLVWGARTTADVGNADWRYVNVRRLMLYLEQSIESGIRWAVFEPNNQALWHKVRRTITEFLTRVWRDGALFGDRPEHAFYVRVDEAINPDTERALGRLHVEIGVRPSYPAEFIVVRIGLWDGGAALSEV